MKLTSTSSTVSAHHPAVSRIGRFYITRELGRGSVGTVYLGHDPVIDRHVAIKTFSAKLSPVEKKAYEQQFINEARAAGRLSHPHIVTIFDACSEAGTTYIAMEYLKGEEISRMLDKGVQFNSKRMASIAWKIADALDYAHRNDVIHRDIKPANIFLSGDDQPTIVDFGIARAPNRVSDQEVSDAEPYTMFHNNIFGTPNYMSPEQAVGRSVDARTDIYSLGAVMYEMSTGRKPFEGSENDRDKLLEMIAFKAPVPPHEINRDIPITMSHIIMKAMSKRPEKRYETADAMGMDIKRFLSRERRAREHDVASVKPQVDDTRKIKSPPHIEGHSVTTGRKLLWVGAPMLIGAFSAAYFFWLRGIPNLF